MIKNIVLPPEPQFYSRFEDIEFVGGSKHGKRRRMSPKRFNITAKNGEVYDILIRTIVNIPVMGGGVKVNVLRYAVERKRATVVKMLDPLCTRPINRTDFIRVSSEERNKLREYADIYFNWR